MLSLGIYLGKSCPLGEDGCGLCLVFSSLNIYSHFGISAQSVNNIFSVCEVRYLGRLMECYRLLDLFYFCKFVEQVVSGAVMETVLNSNSCPHPLCRSHKRRLMEKSFGDPERWSRCAEMTHRPRTIATDRSCATTRFDIMCPYIQDAERQSLRSLCWVLASVQSHLDVHESWESPQ